MPKIDKKKELQKLVLMGKEKGFLTYEEINDALPEEIAESESIDEVMSLLEDNYIEVVEKEKQFKQAKKQVAADKEESEKEDALTRGLDPVRLYLKKMGSVALLTREGEIEIAKRIEEGEAEVLDVILNSSMGVKEFLAIGDKIEKGKLRARDVLRGAESEGESTEEEESPSTEVAEGAPVVEEEEGEERDAGSTLVGGLNEGEARVKILEGMALVRSFEKILSGVEAKLLKAGLNPEERKKLREKLASNRRKIVNVFQEINFNRKTINKIVAKFKQQVSRIEEAEREVYGALRKVGTDQIGKFRNLLKDAKKNKKVEEQIKAKHGLDYQGLLEIEHIINEAAKFYKRIIKRTFTKFFICFRLITVLCKLIKPIEN
jgi:RNA polymerase primary sigma factor